MNSAKHLKACARFILAFFSFKRFVVSLYKKLLEPTFSTCFIALDNLCEDFGCSIITDFISTMFGF